MFDCLVVAGAEGEDLEAAGRRAGDLDVEFDAIRRQADFDAVGPFDERQAGAFEILVRAELLELVLVADAVGVDVVDRAAAVVLLG